MKQGMSTLLVWVLVTYTYYGGIQYSPPVADQESCERLKLFNNVVQKCVQIKVVK
jgi:hypothetical protein